MTEKQLQDLIRTEVLTIQQTMNTATAEDRVALREDLGKLVAAASGVNAIKGMIKNRTAQQDAAEFLTPLIEALFADHHTQLVSQITITSTDYSQPSEKTEPSPIPLIEILGNKPIFSELVINFQKTEQIEDYKATKIGGNTEEIVAVKKSLTLNLPTDRNELIFSLKRFNNNQNKINTTITFDSITFNNKKYDITAFIVHEGSTLTAGHYITYIKEADNCWYEYNDAARAKIDTIEGFSKAAYIVKYATSDAIAPNSQNGTINFDSYYSNRCWLNSALAFTNSLTTISKDNLHEVKQLKQSRKEILDNWSKNQQAVTLEEFKDSEESIEKENNIPNKEQRDDDNQNKENLENKTVIENTEIIAKIETQISEEGKYKGHLENNLRHGRGTLIYKNNEKYIGNFQNDIKHGFGIHYRLDGTASIQEWIKGKNINKTDEYHLPKYKNHLGSLWTYIGEFDDLISGTGRVINERQDRLCTGIFTNSLLNDPNASIKNLDSEYKGSLKHGKIDGTEIYTIKNVLEYKGEWLSDRKSGFGTMIHKDFTYEGAWLNNMKNGNGTMTHKDFTYEGAWLNNMRSGNGTMTHKDFAYKGAWLNNMKNGNGKMTHKDFTYEGEWLNDIKNGEGIEIDKFSNKYDGAWLNNMKHGKGYQSYYKQSFIFEGAWDKGQATNGKVIELAPQNKKKIIESTSNFPDYVPHYMPEITNSLLSLIEKSSILKDALGIEQDLAYKELKLQSVEESGIKIWRNIFLEKIACNGAIKIYKVVYKNKSYWLKYNMEKPKEELERFNYYGLLIAKYAVKTPAISIGNIDNKHFTLTEDIKYAKRSPKTGSSPGDEDGTDLLHIMKHNLKNRQLKLSKIGHLVALGSIVDDIKLLNIGYYKNANHQTRLGLFDCNLAKSKCYLKAIEDIKPINNFRDLMLNLNQELNFNGTLKRDQNKKFIAKTLKGDSIFNIYDYELTNHIKKHTERNDIIEHIKEGAFLVAFLKIFNAQKKIITDLTNVTDNDFKPLIQTIETFVKELCIKYQSLVEQWYKNRLQKDETYQEVLININKIRYDEDNNWINDVTTRFLQLEQIANPKHTPIESTSLYPEEEKLLGRKRYFDIKKIDKR
jgi:hypothetical protein